MYGYVLRAKIVLACAEGRYNKEVAAQLRVTESMVALWRRRFIAQRLDGLTDEPRRGRRRRSCWTRSKT
jgi:transposase